MQIIPRCVWQVMESQARAVVALRENDDLSHILILELLSTEKDEGKHVNYRCLIMTLHESSSEKGEGMSSSQFMKREGGCNDKRWRRFRTINETPTWQVGDCLTRSEKEWNGINYLDASPAAELKRADPIINLFRSQHVTSDD